MPTEPDPLEDFLKVTPMGTDDDDDPDRYDAQGYLDPDNGCFDHEGNFIGRPVNW